MIIEFTVSGHGMEYTSVRINYNPDKESEKTESNNLITYFSNLMVEPYIEMGANPNDKDKG